MLKNAKRDPLGSINVFHKPTLSKKFKGVPFDRIHKFSEKKSHGAEKKQRVPFGLPSTFGNIEKLVV